MENMPACAPTNRLYYDDAYRTAFDARVVFVRPGGWVALEWLSRTSASPSSGSSGANIKSGGVYRVTASKLNVRDGAGTSSKVRDVISKGTSVTVSYTNGNWAWVTYSGGRSGFVYMDYLG